VEARRPHSPGGGRTFRRVPVHPRSRLRDRTARAIASRRVFPYLAAITFLLAIGVGITVRLVAPKDFHSVGEGMWWAVVTLGTVGYGDVVPTTPWGRVVGALTIILGVTFLAFLTATVTSMFVSNEQRGQVEALDAAREESEEELVALLRRLDERLAAIEARLDRGAAG
jgi:voltage-gated potassium channel